MVAGNTAPTMQTIITPNSESNIVLLFHIPLNLMAFAERLNRSIMEAAEAMRINACLSKFFWADAVNTSIYLLNRRYHSTIGMTPFQAWQGKRTISISFKNFRMQLV